MIYKEVKQFLSKGFQQGKNILYHSNTKQKLFLLITLEIAMLLTSGLLYAAELLKLRYLAAYSIAYENSIDYLLEYPLNISFLVVWSIVGIHIMFVYFHLKNR